MEKKAEELRLFDDLKTEEFVVDDLFDFSNEELEDGVFGNLENEIESEAYSVPVTVIENGVRTEDLGFDPVLGTELCIPVDDVANLEWLSQFVEDSFSGYSVPLPVKPTESVKTDELAEQVPENPVQTKVRSKRGRTGVRVWSMTSPPLTDSPLSSSSTSSSSGRTSDTVLIPQSPTKQPRKKVCVSADTGHTRRCSHCGVQKTPQWRAGPSGPKTLCNACGVRYKSGRLVPEYRPACSPTFSSEVHSNNHRKVLEMRRLKEAGPISGPIK